MTRENKIALVVGFALILVVGILVSDHFSVAQTQQSAELLPAHDPLSGQRRADRGLLRFDPPRSAPLIANERAPQASFGDGAGHDLRGQPRHRPIGPESANGRNDARAVASAMDGRDPVNLSYAYHRIASGESLSSICKSYYGDESLAADLARFNDITDPDLIVLDQRLKLPAATSLVRSGSRSPESQTQSPVRPAPRPPTEEPARAAKQAATYTVRNGDVLSVIAQRTLGSSRRWSEIYDLNRDRIKSPDHVTVGTVLRLPAG